MLRSRFLAGALAVTSAFALASPAVAQSPYQTAMAPQPTPDADALAASMRRLAENPRDLDALITAGELSLKVGDASGAAALFKRAEGVDPMNGRVKAGMARILVTQERPGEALRYFDQAVGYGLDPRSFAGDRGLAYDLIGEQDRAQRDYRLALKAGGADASGDEVRRRYALSLGISGKQLPALEQLEPLIRRNDRGAWRARAFILAMTGDIPNANRIAQTMMPGAIGQGLGSFFVVLPTLAPVDRAFAVHFGEVRATPQRIADARLTPALPVLGPDPDARVMVAAAPPPPAPTRNRRDRRRRATERVEVARAAPQPTTPAPGFGRAGESPTDPARRVGSASVPVVAAPVAVAQVPALRPAPAPVQVAALPPAAANRPRESVDLIQKPTLADYTRADRYNQAIAAQLARARTAAPSVAQPTPIPAPTQFATSVPAASSAPNQVASSTPAPLPPVPASSPNPTIVASTAPAVATPPPAVASPPVVATPLPTSRPTALAAAPTPTPTPPHASEDSILSRIVAGLSVPGYELGVGSPPPADPPPATVAGTTPAPSAAPVEVASVQPAPAPGPAARPAPVEAHPVRSAPEPAAAKPPVRVATRAMPSRRAAVEPAPIDEEEAPAPRRGRAGRVAPVEVAAAEPRRRGAKASVREPDDDTATTGTRPSGRRGAKASARDGDDDKPVDRSTGRRGTDRKALAAKDEDDTPRKGKIARKDDDAKPAKGEPARIWVQVAGGANESDLPKAYAAVQSRTPALKGKAAYSTPLRATNRVVTGPFKTDAEARAFVNQLAKQGVSAFPFTSDKGQKMTKLPPK